MPILRFIKPIHFWIGYVGCIILFFWRENPTGADKILMYILLIIGIIIISLKIYTYFTNKEIILLHGDTQQLVGFTFFLAIITMMFIYPDSISGVGSLIYIGTLILVGCIFLLLEYKYRKGEKRKQRVQELFGSSRELLTKLGWSDVTFPIIAMGGKDIGITHISSLDDYINYYLFKTGLFGKQNVGVMSDKVIDALGREYATHKVALKELGYTTKNIGNMKLQCVASTGNSVEFEYVKKKFLAQVLNDGKASPYRGLVKEIKQAKDAYQLDSVLQKGIFKI